MRMLLKLRKPSIDLSSDWPRMLRDFVKLMPSKRVIVVLWELPKNEWIKYNIDGA